MVLFGELAEAFLEILVLVGARLGDLAVYFLELLDKGLGDLVDRVVRAIGLIERPMVAGPGEPFADGLDKDKLVALQPGKKPVSGRPSSAAPSSASTSASRSRAASISSRI